jgi:hypothetical protein
VPFLEISVAPLHCGIVAEHPFRVLLLCLPM